MIALIASIVVALAGLLHGYIFLMESVWWTRPRDLEAVRRRRPGSGRHDAADGVQPGFYNLFLGIGAIVGLVLFWAGAEDVGKALVLFTTACMTLAAAVLTTTGPGYLKPAVIQGTLPLIGFVLFLFA